MLNAVAVRKYQQIYHLKKSHAHIQLLTVPLH